MASRGTSSGAGRGARSRARPGARARAPPEPAARSRRSLAGTRLRPLAERPHLSAALLLALFVLIYLWPVLIGGKILSPISLLYVLNPWQHYAPADLHSYFNLELSDVATADYPWRALLRQLLHEGAFPAWNPHVFAGSPFYANPQTGLFSVFSLPLWILPLNYAIGLAAALKLWAGAFGMYLLVRQLRLGFLPGLLAGVAFAFSALDIVWLTHETLPAVVALLPWMVLFVERIFARGRPADAIGLAVATAIGLGGGHPGMQVHIMVVSGLYVLARSALTPAASRAERLRPLALAGGALGGGAMLMGLMLVPEALSSQGTLGTVARHAGSSSLPGVHEPLGTLKTTIFPDWWGRPSSIEVPEEQLPAGIEGYNERTFYAGSIALLLGCVGLLSRGDWRRKAPFAVLAFVGLAVPLHFPGLYWLATHLPILRDVQSQRLHFAYAFGIAVLAAFGLHALIERPAEERRRLLVPLAALLVVVVAIATAGAHAGDVGHAVDHFLTGKDFESAGVLALTSIAWFALLAAGAGLALLAARRWPRHSTAIAAAVVLLGALDAYHFAAGYQPMGPASKAIPPTTPAIAYLQRHERDGRFAGLGNTLITEWATTYGLDDVRGYDPPQPTLRWYRLWLKANPSQTNWQAFTTESLGGESLRVLSVLGARYVIGEPGLRAPAPGAAGLRPLTRRYAGADATVLENPNALPRALVAPAVHVTANEAATRDALVEGAFDPRAAVVVERDQPGAAGLAGLGGGGRVAIVHERNASVTLHATMARRGLVVLDDDYTAGWSVRVDGRAARPLHVDDVMRGVVVGPGSHTVTWSYAVPGLRAGLALSLLAFVALAGAGAAIVVRERRRGVS